uniref:Potassium channel subfamily K member 18 n=1 Tax=Parastrongyloides trichosuri TaxID=131310 RepID=A0A0N5A195_PARTI
MAIFTKIRRFDISNLKKIKEPPEDEILYREHYLNQENINPKHSLTRTPSIPIILPLSNDNNEITTTLFQDDGRVSRYDNVSRPFSGTSFSAGDLSLKSKDTGVILEEEEFCGKKILLSNFLHGSKRSILSSLMYDSKNDLSYGDDGISKNDEYHSPVCLKLKILYDKCNIRHFAPFIILLIYAFLGAGLFYYIEHENEILMKKNEEIKISKLRNETIYRLKNIMLDEIITLNSKLLTAKDILTYYEDQLLKEKGEQRLDWDFVGALYYVGSIVTTIGYGNIYCRTNIGRGFTIIYSIISIPLVLAILSHCGRTLTAYFSDKWIRYRNRLKEQKLLLIKNKRIEENNLLNRERNLQSNQNNEDVFIPINDDEENKIINVRESRTIPIWLALLLCVGWICCCAGLFCIWETRWSYYTSLYFFFISLSTIGLGDVVPDHPHMLVLLFCLVIIGLSIVSMLLSVIQIKIEEWFYDLMMKMQEEYRKAMENGDTDKANEIREHLMDNEPWYLKQMASHLLSDNQNTKLDEVAEKYEMVMKSTNTRSIQTDDIMMAVIERKVIDETEAIFGLIEDIEYNIEEAERQKSLQNQTTYQSAVEDVVVIKDDDYEKIINDKTNSFNNKNDGDNSSIDDALSLPYDFCDNNKSEGDVSIPTIEEKLIDNKKVELVDRSVCMSEGMKDNKVNTIDCGTSMSLNLMVDRSVENLYEEIAPNVVLEDFGTMTLFDNMMAEEETQTSERSCYSKECTTSDLIKYKDANFGTSKLNTKSVSLNTEVIDEEEVVALIDVGVGEDKSQQTSIRDDYSQISEMTRKYELEIGEMKAKLEELEKFSSSSSSIPSTHQSHTSVQCHSLSGSPGPYQNDIAISTTPPPESVDASSMTILTASKIKQLQKIRKNSNVGGRGIKEPQDNETKTIKHDLIIQTDDSYLKIARRLNEYKTQKSSNLSVVAAKPINLNDIIPNTNGEIPPSERREYCKEPKSIRKRFGTLKKKLQGKCDNKAVQSSLPGKETEIMSVSYSGVTENRNYNLIPDRMFCSDDGSSLDFNNIPDDVITNAEGFHHNPSNTSLCGSLANRDGEKLSTSTLNSKRNSTSRRESTTSFGKEKSLPPQVQRGKVSNFIAQHEKGVHDPGTSSGRRKSLITIIDMRDQGC